MGYDERYVDVDGISTRYFEAGSGEPLVLIHGGNFGWDASAEEWVPVIDGFAEKFRVLAIDRLGQGMTGNPASAEDYVVGGWVSHARGFLKAMGLDSAHIVGHSRGGYVGCRLALESPELVRTLTIVDSATLMIPPRFNKVEGVDDLAEWARRTMAAHSFSEVHITPDLIEAMVAMRQLPKMVEARERFAELRDAFGRDLVARQHETHGWIEDGRLRAPTLVLWGFNDPSAPWDSVGRDTVKLILPNASNAQVHVLNEAGHYCFREQPTAFVAAVTGFIDQQG